MRSRHGALILHRSRIMATACNVHLHNDRAPPFASLHAEVHVILKFLERFPRRMLRDCTLFVIRADKTGSLLNSRPCSRCQCFIERHELGKVIHS